MRADCLGFLAQGDAAEIAALNRERGPFDLLLTTDTLYDRTTQPLLADTIAALAAPHTAILVASPDRGTIFFEHLRRHGLEEVADLSADREVQVAKTLLREELRRGRGSVKVHRIGRGARL